MELLVLLEAQARLVRQEKLELQDLQDPRVLLEQRMEIQEQREQLARLAAQGALEALVKRGRQGQPDRQTELLEPRAEQEIQGLQVRLEKLELQVRLARQEQQMEQLETQE